MTIKSADKRRALLAELEEKDMDALNKTLNLLDNYTVNPPSSTTTDHLLSLLTPVLENELAAQNFAVGKTTLLQSVFEHLRLAAAQTKLISRWFIFLSAVFFLCGLSLTNALAGDTLRFLANGSPLLGILTVLYQFRASYNNMSELEAACPYTPAQLAAAKFLVVLGYDILLCLAATPFVSYENYILWQVVAHWLAPLLLTLGIALLASLPFGIFVGCLVSTTAWAFNLAISKYGKSIFSVLLPQTSVIYLDLLSTLLGLLLIAFSFSRLNTAQAWTNKNQHT